MKCACGCGQELSKRRALISKYIRGHYSKMRKNNPTKIQTINEEINKIMKDKKFKDKYWKLVGLKTRLKHLRSRKVKKEDNLIVVDYSKGCKFCSKYDNDDIKCVMCLESHFEKPGICPKEK